MDGWDLLDALPDIRAMIDLVLLVQMLVAGIGPGFAPDLCIDESLQHSAVPSFIYNTCRLSGLFQCLNHIQTQGMRHFL